MPDATGQLMGVDANGDSGAPQPQHDAYSELLGETGGNPVSRYFAHTAARNSGAALEAAHSRYQTQQTQLKGLQDQIERYGGSGITSFFSPEIEKAYKSLGGNPELYKASQQQAQAMAARRGQLREDHQRVFGAYQDQYGGGTPAAAGAGPAGQSPATAGGPPASTGGGADLIDGGGAGGATPASTAPTAASGPGMHWSHPSYDWSSHKESPALTQMYGEMKELQRAAIDSEGLPEHDDIVDQLKTSSTMYDKMLDMEMGFGQKTALQSQHDAGMMDRQQVHESGANARAAVGRGQTGRASIENKNAALHAQVDTQAGTYASKGFGSEGEAQAAADLLNAQRRRANQHGAENKIDPVNQFFQVKAAHGVTGGLLGDNYTIEPTDSDPAAKKADAKAAPAGAAPAAAPKKIETADPLEGATASAPGKPTLVRKGGKWVQADAQ